MSRITRCTRAITSRKSNSAVDERTPNSADRFDWDRNFAVRISALDGTQPV